MTFFSQREAGPAPRTLEAITLPVWQGLVSIIRGRVEDGSFGYTYPEHCPDGPMVIGTDADLVGAAFRGHFPGLVWPLVPNEYGQPAGLVPLDIVEFTYEKIAQPVPGASHEYYRGHRNLDFDVHTGRQKFRAEVNRLFEVNGLAFNLEPDGRVIRLAPEGLRQALAEAIFNTGDAALDGLLEAARAKFLGRDPAQRQEALEKLWDAFERVKTLEHPDKPRGVAILLDRAARDGAPRIMLENDFRAFTEIGNNFNIRHFEHDRAPVPNGTFVDYFFHRGFAAITLVLRATGRMR